MKVILDANFLIYSLNVGIDLLYELKQLGATEINVLNGVLTELEALSTTGERHNTRTAARLALELIKAKNINIIPNLREKSVDDCLFLLSRNGYYIATMDKELKKRIGSGRIIVLRQKKHLIIV
ncbi:MAG: hypothetical protein QXK37_05870 [Candidatus Woesearchaeota archaeon]